MPYTYRDVTVNFIQVNGYIDEGKIAWVDEGEEWCACGETLEEAQAAFREAIDDNLDQ